MAASGGVSGKEGDAPATGSSMPPRCLWAGSVVWGRNQMQHLRQRCARSSRRGRTSRPYSAPSNHTRVSCGRQASGQRQRAFLQETHDVVLQRHQGGGVRQGVAAAGAAASLTYFPCVPPRPRRRSVRAQWRWSSCTERVGEDDNTTLARQRCASGAAPRLVHLYAVRATSTVHSAPLKTPVCVVRAAPAADDGAVCVRPSQKVRQRLRCAAALMRLQVPRNRVSPDLGFSELNEAPHVKRLQLAKNVAEGCRAQCSGHPAQEVALPHQANRGLATPNNRFWRSRAA